MKRNRLFAYALSGCMLLISLTSFAMPAHFGQNLIINGGAEVDAAGRGSALGLVPGWVSQQNGAMVIRYGANLHSPTIEQSSQLNGGVQFFAGGAGMRDVYMQQFIDLKPFSDWIDLGRAKFQAMGWFGGFGNKDDTAGISLTFLNDQQDLVSYRLGDIDAFARGNKTGLIFQDMNEFVPIGATQLMVTLDFHRMSGDYNYAYADNLFFSINSVPEPNTVGLIILGMVGILGGWSRRRQI
ncbi:PEP-CTERM sorting domain-containing protein [Chitinivorax sp. B]|uniref:PEP-CTERM sorting domain-containing protein n=1 Tax=Chitinivorax sp. B TaxID=2502235 RepID=UPI0010F68DFA|nr:PEP-CTERM sorting domain-containing protein [Chitinivorax sp. B]